MLTEACQKGTYFFEITQLIRLCSSINISYQDSNYLPEYIEEKELDYILNLFS